MWGPRRSSGVRRRERGTQTPKSMKIKNFRNKTPNQNPKLPEILLLWIQYKPAMSLKKFLCIQKFLEKL